MISEAAVEFQVGRLDATVNFKRKSDQAKAELVELLLKNATDEAEIERAISVWLVEKQYCPSPAELLPILRSVRRDPVEPHSRSFAFQGGCTRCQGSGWYVVYQLCKQTLGGVLARDLSGWQEASAIRDKWKAERLAWNDANPGRIFKLRDSESIGQSARRCGCR